MIASLPPVLDAQHDVAGVGDEAHRLPDDEHRVEADAGVGHDDARPHQTDDPEANGKDGGVAAVRVVPLVDEPDGEDELPRGTKDKQPQRNLRIMEEAVDEGWRIG